MNLWSVLVNSLTGSRATRASSEMETVKETILEKMPTPPLLAKQIAQLLTEIKFRDEDERKWAERNFKMCGLFEGKDVLCRDTEEGTEILAAGTCKEVAKCLETLSDDVLSAVYIERPPLWVF